MIRFFGNVSLSLIFQLSPLPYALLQEGFWVCVRKAFGLTVMGMEEKVGHLFGALCGCGTACFLGALLAVGLEFTTVKPWSLSSHLG